MISSWGSDIIFNRLFAKFPGSNSASGGQTLAVMATAITPFKSKAEERATLVKAKDDGSTESPPAKRGRSTYDKQLAKMDGDTSLVKDPL